jgi:hypothetical protein
MFVSKVYMTQIRSDYAEIIKLLTGSFQCDRLIVGLGEVIPVGFGPCRSAQIKAAIVRMAMPPPIAQSWSWVSRRRRERGRLWRRSC